MKSDSFHYAQPCLYSSSITADISGPGQLLLWHTEGWAAIQVGCLCHCWIAWPCPRCHDGKVVVSPAVPCFHLAIKKSSYYQETAWHHSPIRWGKTLLITEGNVLVRWFHSDSKIPTSQSLRPLCSTLWCTLSIQSHKRFSIFCVIQVFLIGIFQTMIDNVILFFVQVCLSIYVVWPGMLIPEQSWLNKAAAIAFFNHCHTEAI